jgi:outer membrane protein assembly factor BamB
MFRALDRKTGSVVWETQAGPGSGQYFFHGDPLITANVVIVGADDAARVGNVHAFDKSTGRERWRFPAGHGVNSAIVGWGRRAYAATLQGELVSLDVESGEARWRLPLKVPTWERTAAVAGHVFAGTVDGSLYALNADTGKEEWRVSLGAPVTTSIDASESAVYVGTANGTVYRINSQSGAVLSSRKLDDQLRPRSSLVRTKDSLLVLLTDEGADVRALVSVDPNLDKVRWRQTATTHWDTSRVFVWGELALIGAPSGEVVAYCAADGSRVWSRSVAGSIRAIGGSEDTLYVGVRQGSLYALRASKACNLK